MELRPWFVVVVVFYVSTRLVLQYKSIVHVQLTETQGGPRAREGTRTTGNIRALIHGHLKAAH